MMNVDQFEGKWQTIKGKVRERWGKFTSKDIEQMTGKQEQIIGKLQEVYGLDRELAKKEFELWLALQPDDRPTEPSRVPPGR
jgi:uncharacterized protein YjbJ (UPF0337 family)